ncbi:hypothetical protein M2368_003131 [Arthrobacter sp. JUb119]|nr:hypothetical protein [Arthrobacter sp. JUb119]
MAGELPNSTQAAFHQFTLALKSIRDDFSRWGNQSSGTAAMARVRHDISRIVVEGIEITLSSARAALDIVGVLEATDFSHLENTFAGAYSPIRLDSALTFDHFHDLVEWVENDFVAALDSARRTFSVMGTNPNERELTELLTEIRLLRLRVIKELDAEELELLNGSSRENLSEVQAMRKSLKSELAKSSHLVESVQRLEQENARKTKTLEDLLSVIDDKASAAVKAAESFEAARTQLNELNEEKSSSELIEHFGAFSTDHDNASKKLFKFGIGTVIALAIFAVFYTFEFSTMAFTRGFSWPDLTWKLSVLVGGSSVGTYLLRLASYHRRLSVWSNAVQVQLRTFAPFTEQVAGDASKDQLRLEFARRVFGAEPDGTKEKSDEGSGVTMSDLTSLIDALAKAQSQAAKTTTP